MKILLCIAVHLYSGPIDSGTPVTEMAQSCKQVSVTAARKSIAKCSAEGAMSCEAIVSKDRSRITLEYKIQATAGK